MKPPPSPLAPRLLGLVLLLGIGGLVYLENGSTFSEAIRQRSPWLVWTAVRSQDDLNIFLLIYQPDRRSLDIVYIPPTPPAPGARALKDIDDPRERAAYAQDWLERQAPDIHGRQSAYLYLDIRRLPEFEPPAALKVWIQREWQGLTFWKNLTASTLRGAQASGAIKSFESTLDLFDLVLLALEASRLDPGVIRPAWLPEGELRSHLITRLLARPPPRQKKAPPIRAEVLNASAINKVASKATKVLRLKGVDVVYYGNAETRSQSVVYDRLGRIENALLVAERLDCDAAEAITRVDPNSLVEVTVILAADCVKKAAE